MFVHFTKNTFNILKGLWWKKLTTYHISHYFRTSFYRYKFLTNLNVLTQISSGDGFLVGQYRNQPPLERYPRPKHTPLCIPRISWRSFSISPSNSSLVTSTGPLFPCFFDVSSWKERTYTNELCTLQKDIFKTFSTFQILVLLNEIDCRKSYHWHWIRATKLSKQKEKN